ncbi:hydantoinase/oxoprolinase family protein [Halobacteriales archaeon Cl-PHB]
MDDAVRLGVDVGGTFTDVVLLADGAVTTTKVPTTPADQSDGVIRGVRRACDAAGVDPGAVDRFRTASTVATNALLEDAGAEVALVTTAGFADVLAIGRQDRPALYDLDAERPDPLVPAERRYDVAERATPDGIEHGVDETAVSDLADRIPESADAVAVCLLHSYAHPENERRVADVLRAECGAVVTASTEVLATFREYERTATTAADAAVTPVIRAYLDGLTAEAATLGLPTPRVMQSNGGIADAAAVRDHGVTTALSGPAAGVVGAALFEPPEAAGVVSFDMGGTSTDVGLVRDGDVARTTDAAVGGHPIGLPMVDVETVGAGGGSVARVDAGGALRVGPDSAGARPGPACYGQGGTEPTVTDAALELGYLGADAELGGDLRLDADAATAVLGDLGRAAALDGDPASAAAAGVVEVATATMARAVRRVTVERGHDPRTFSLVAFGGAGPLFAAALADRLGLSRVRVPRANGVLSALGLLAADERHDAVRTHRTRLDAADAETVEGMLADLAGRVRADASDTEALVLTREADCRYAGQRHELTVPLSPAFDPETVAERFHAAHETARGYRMEVEPVELVGLRVAGTIPGALPAVAHEGSDDARAGTRRVWFDDEPVETAVFDRGSLAVGRTLAGPAVLEGGESTVVVPPAWTATVDDRGTLDLVREGSA